MKCTRCRAPAVIEVRRHNAAFCRACFLHAFRGQVERAIETSRCRRRATASSSRSPEARTRWRCGTCCSSSATAADGLYLGLGIGGYSDRSSDVTAAFAREREAALDVVDLAEAYGFDIPTAGRKGSRSTCAVCGLSKRYVFNKAALDGGFDVVATGHNLDDEAATLLGNTLRWQTDEIARQSPVLPAKAGMVKKVKPLFRLSELETAAYAFLRGIDYVVEECPLVGGNTQLRYKEAMNRSSRRRRGRRRSSSSATSSAAPVVRAPPTMPTLTTCEACGQPTTGRFCAFCRAQAQILGDRLGAAPAGARGAANGDERPSPRSSRTRSFRRARRRRGALTRMGGPFEPGERVLFIDQRGRQYLVKLHTGGTFHSHGGAVAHDDILGARRGDRRPQTSAGMVFRSSARGSPTTS